MISVYIISIFLLLCWWHYAKFDYAECQWVSCHYIECRGAQEQLETIGGEFSLKLKECFFWLMGDAQN